MPLTRRMARYAALLVPAVVGVLLWSQSAYANVALTQVSSDPFTISNSQHRTEVEPDTFQFGSTIVAAFQVGRISGVARPTSVSPCPTTTAVPGPTGSCPASP